MVGPVGLFVAVIATQVPVAAVASSGLTIPGAPSCYVCRRWNCKSDSRLVSVSPTSDQARVLLTAMKQYGVNLAENGSPWYVTESPSTGWNDDDLHQLQKLHGSDFEVVDTP